MYALLNYDGTIRFIFIKLYFITRHFICALWNILQCPYDPNLMLYWMSVTHWRPHQHILLYKYSHTHMQMYKRCGALRVVRFSPKITRAQINCDWDRTLIHMEATTLHRWKDERKKNFSGTSPIVYKRFCAKINSQMHFPSLLNLLSRGSNSNLTAVATPNSIQFNL